MSARQYTKFGQEDFEQFLGEFAQVEQVSVSNTKENVYALDTPDDTLKLYIFSTLQNGQNRSKGSDAIRVVFWDTEQNKPVGGETKTLRIQTWRKNLKRKVQNLMASWRDYNKHCDKCDSRMARRESQYGQFWGCTNYPRCDHTVNI